MSSDEQSDRPDALTFPRPTPEEVEALRLLRLSSPGWLTLDWRRRDARLPPAARVRVSTAKASWTPFTLHD